MHGGSLTVQQLQAYQLAGSLLHGIKHASDAVTLLQALLVTLELIPEILDNEPFQVLCFLVPSCIDTENVQHGDWIPIALWYAGLRGAQCCSYLEFARAPSLPLWQLSARP